MPNAAAHKALGAVCGMAASNYYVTPFLRPEEEENGKPTLLLTGLMAGGVGGRIPDVLDPPIHPNHRGIYHSVAMGCIALCGAILTVKALEYLYQRHCQTRTRSRGPQTTHESSGSSSGISLKQAAVGAVILALLAGILSHLVADAGTPKGLPVLR